VIAVTGATGYVGGRTAALLAERGVPLRLVVRDAGRAPDLGAEVRQASAYGAGDEMRATGRNVTYKDETLEEAWASRAIFGAPDWMVEAWISTYTAVARGELDDVTDTVQRFTGRPPLTLPALIGAGDTPPRG
jgi:NAD(P)H dehydrogenase (quinone)